MIRSVLDTALTVSDLDRSIRFYCDILGFAVAAELPPAAERDRWDAYHIAVSGVEDARINVAYLVAGDGQSHLELIEYVTPRDEGFERSRVSRPGTSIVALAPVDSDAAVVRLREAGATVLSDPVPYVSDEGARSKTTYFRDPDGNVLCLFEILDDE